MSKQKDIEVVPGPWVLPKLPAIPSQLYYLREPSSDCLVDAFLKAEPNTRVLGLVCPCPKCTVTCM